MSRKKKPINNPEASKYVTYNDAFAAFLQAAQAIGNEVEARRRFHGELGTYLAEKNLIDDFESWRQARDPKSNP